MVAILTLAAAAGKAKGPDSSPAKTNKTKYLQCVTEVTPYFYDFNGK